MKIDRLIVCAVVSWLGLWIHEVHRVPALLGFTPDGDLFMLLMVAGLALWWSRTHASSAAAALLVYAVINLVGGVMSVLPLGWLPFRPEQTLDHYAVHAVYAVAQLPLTAVAAQKLLRPAQSATR